MNTDDSKDFFRFIRVGNAFLREELLSNPYLNNVSINKQRGIGITQSIWKSFIKIRGYGK